MAIPTESYEIIHERYCAAIQWINSLGVKLGLGRTSHYEKIIKHWTNAYRTSSPGEGQEIFVDFVSSLFEIKDFINIYEAFKDVEPHRLAIIIEKLQKGVNGPINMADEGPESAAARNFLFEAATAASFHRPNKNIEAIFDAKSDTGFLIKNVNVWVECKRVTSIGKLERNVRKASSQLEMIILEADGPKQRGIVAIDISKILNRGDQIYVTANDNQLRRSTSQMMDQFITEHSYIWESVYRRRSPKVIGTIIRFAFMSSSEERNILVHTSEWALNPRLGIRFDDEQILRELVAGLEAP